MQISSGKNWKLRFAYRASSLPRMRQSETEAYQVPALTRALRILELLAEHREGLRMREIAERLELPPNSVFRITATLEERGYLMRDADDMRYRLTRKLLSLGYAAVGEEKLIEYSLDVMQALRDATHETVLVGIRADLHGLVLEQVAASQPVKFLVDPGTQFPLHASAPGKVLLAFLPRAERSAFLDKLTYTRYNERTLDTRAKFERELERVSKQGYGVDFAEQIEGLHCVGAPIFNHRGYPIAAIWVTGPSFRFSTADLHRISDDVTASASKISKRFGHQLI